MDQIIIEQLKVDAVIGVFAWERQITQPLMVDLVLDVDIKAAAASDALADAVNYQAVCEQVTRVIIETKAQLIEHLAEKICQVLFGHFAAIARIGITVRKPGAIAQAGAVGVRIERLRNGL